MGRWSCSRSRPWPRSTTRFELFTRLDEAAAEASRGSTPALVVSTERLLPQPGWDRFGRQLWLSPEPDDLAR